MQQRAADPRIARTFGNDRRWAVTALAVLWGTYVFVMYEVYTKAHSPEILWALAAAGGLVLLFNTASIIAMMVHFGEDQEQIYGLDLHYLDAARSSKA